MIYSQKLKNTTLKSLEARTMAVAVEKLQGQSHEYHHSVTTVNFKTISSAFLSLIDTTV